MKEKNQKDAHGLTPELRAQGWMTSDEWHAENMRDPEYKALWEEGEPERQALFARVAAQIEKEQQTKENKVNRNRELKLGFTA